MIVRLWHGWTAPSDADAYEQLLDTTIVPGILARRIPGLRSIDILRRDRDGNADVEFVTSIVFDDWRAVEAFGGPDPTASVVPAAARELLSRYDDHSQHYELVARHPGTT